MLNLFRHRSASPEMEKDRHRQRKSRSPRKVLSQIFTSPEPIPRRFIFPTVVKVRDNGHPYGLGNPEIIQHIFEHMRTRDLKRVRRVSLRWNYVACEILKRKSNYCVIPQLSQMRHFVKMMKSSIHNPIGSYAILIENSKDKTIQQFLADLGQDVLRLRLKITSNQMPALTHILQHLPNLEELRIIRIPEEFVSSVCNLEYSRALPSLSLPNLRRITFEKDNESRPFSRNYDSCLVAVINSSQVLEQVRFVNWESPLSSTLHCIRNPRKLDMNDMCSHFGVEQLQQLVDYNNLKFTSLKLSTNEGKIPHYVLWNSVFSSKDTLVHLELNNENDPSSNFPFIIKETIHSLLSLNANSWRNLVDFPSIQRNVPNLTELRLSAINVQSLNEINQKPLPVCRSVKVLTLMPLEASVNDSTLTKLSHIFPNLNRIFVQIFDNAAAHAVYKGWPNLEILFIDFKGHNVTNEAVTGIPVRKSILTSPSFHKHDSSISILKNLTCLALRSGCNLTNECLKEICQMTWLEALWLLPNRDDFAYPWSIQKIAEHLKLKHLTTSVKVEYSQEEIDYLRKKLPWMTHEYK